MFAPVGFAGASVKVSPPLCVNKEQLDEGLGVLREAMEESVNEFAAEAAAKA